MAGIGVPELLIILIVLLLLVGGLVAIVVLAVILATRLTRRRDQGAPVPTSAESRRILLTRLVGLGVGVAAAWWTARQGSLGTGLMLAPAVLGLCVIVAMTVGETVVRPSRAPGPRTASLRARRVRDYAPPVLLRAVELQLLAVVALLVLTTVTAGREGDSTPPRVLSCDGGTYGSSAGPYPGSFYSVPLALVLLVVLVVAALGARQVLRRPRGGAAPDSAEVDDVLRRRSLGVVVAATGVALAAPYVGVALTAGSALQRLGQVPHSCAAAWMGPTGIVIGLTALPAGVLVLACLTVLLGGRAAAPAPRELAHR